MSQVSPGGGEGRGEGERDDEADYAILPASPRHPYAPSVSPPPTPTHVPVAPVAPVAPQPPPLAPPHHSICDPPLECRICRDSDPPLQPACACATVVHPHCLRRWLRARADAHFPLLSASERHVCEVCRQPVNAEVRRSWRTSPTAAPTAPPRAVGSGARYVSVDGELDGETHDEYRVLQAGADGATAVDADGDDGAKVPFAQQLQTHFWPHALADRAESLCHYLLSVEGCLLIFLIVLAGMGHALFVLGVYRGSANDAYSAHRLALAAANAVLTVTVLVLVHKLVSRCLRDADSGAAALAAANGGGAYLATDGGPGADGGGVRWTTVGQFVLGATLSLVAAAEIFLIVQHLPLGVLA